MSKEEEIFLKRKYGKEKSVYAKLVTRISIAAIEFTFGQLYPILLVSINKAVEHINMLIPRHYGPLRGLFF